MHVMAFHAQALKNAMKAQQCAPAQSQSQLQHMQLTAQDIDPVFAGADPQFFEHAKKLHDALAQAMQAAPANCQALAAAMKPVGEACESCHKQYAN